MRSSERRDSGTLSSTSSTWIGREAWSRMKRNACTTSGSEIDSTSVDSRATTRKGGSRVTISAGRSPFISRSSFAAASKPICCAGRTMLESDGVTSVLNNSSSSTPRTASSSGTLIP